MNKREEIKLHRKAIADLKDEPVIFTIIKRIILAPVMALILFISSIMLSLQSTIEYLLYGGEVLVYHKGINRKSIADVYNSLNTRLK